MSEDNKKPELVVIKNDEKPQEVKRKKVKKSTKNTDTPKANVKKVNNKKENKKRASKKPSNKRLKKINLKILALCILALALILALAYFFTTKVRVEVEEKNSLFTTEFGVNSKADFRIIDKNVFYSTKDAATLLNQKGVPP